MTTPPDGLKSVHDGEPILLLNRMEVRGLLRWPDLIAATSRALIDLAERDAPQSVASQLVVPRATLHLKAGALMRPPVLSVKANLRPDTGNTAGAILAFDYDAQRLHAVIASRDLTAMRTAAIAAVAARALSGRRRLTVALVGAGPVAKHVDEALNHLELASEVRIWSRTRQRAAHLATASTGEVEHRVFEDVAEAVAGADLVVSCTPSRAPLVFREHLSAQPVILAMGADSVGKRELGDGILESSDLYADVREDALRLGECAHLDGDNAAQVKNIGSFLPAGIKRSPDRSVVFDSVGSSTVDAAAVALVLEMAQLRGVGRWIQLDGETG